MGDAIGDSPIGEYMRGAMKLLFGEPTKLLAYKPEAAPQTIWAPIENLGWMIIPEPMSAADDPAPAGPTKPYNEAVNDVHRYLKEVVEKAADTHIEGPVKEGVIKDLDQAIEKRSGQKPWPGQ